MSVINGSTAAGSFTCDATTRVGKVRRMIADTVEASALFTDEEIQVCIEAHPLVDPYGYSPDDPNEYYEVNPDWTPTYDLNAAAADLWEAKAGRLAGDFDFAADGGNYSRSQAYEMAMKQARYFRARRSLKTVTMQASPKKPLAPEELDSDESN